MSITMPPEQSEQLPLENLSTRQLTERARRLLAFIQELLTELSTSTDTEKTTLLQDRTAQFATVIDQIHTNTQRTADIIARVLEWKSQQGDRVQRYQPVANALARLEQRLLDDHLALEAIEDVLKLCESAIEAYEHYKSNKLELARILTKGDVEIDDPHMEDLLKQSKQLKQTLDDAAQKIHQAMDNAQPKELLPSTQEQPKQQSNDNQHTDATSRPKTAPAPTSPDPKPPPRPLPTTPQRNADQTESKSTQESPPQDTQVAPVRHKSKSAKKAPITPAPHHPPSTTQSPTITEIKKRISTALDQHRFAIAFHLASLRRTVLPTANVVKMVATNFVDHTEPQMLADLPILATELRAEASTVLDSNASAESKASYVVLLATSCLWPSTVIAPGGPVAQLIKYLVSYLDRFPELQDLASTVADISLKGLPILPNQSTGQESWQQRCDKLRIEIMNWIATEQNTTLRFPPATQLWRYLLKDWQPSNDHPTCASLGFILNSLMKTPPLEKAPLLQPLLEHWRKNADKEIDRLDAVLRHKRVTRDRITGPVRTRLKRKIQNAVTLADEWISIATLRPNSQTAPHVKIRDQLVATIHEVRPALEAKNLFQTRHMYAPDLTHQMVLRYVNLFKQSSAEEIFHSNVNLDELLSGDLFASERVAYNDDGTPTPTADELFQLVHTSKPDYSAAIILRAKAGRFDLVEKALTYGERRRIRGSTLLTEDETKRIRTEVSNCHAEMKDRIDNELREILLEIDTTYALGALTAQQSEQLREQSQLEISTSSGTVNFIALHHKLATLKDKLTDAKSSLKDSMYRRLRLLNAPADADRERTVSAIEEERFLLADEFLDWLAQDKRLPDSTDRMPSQLDDFYPTFVKTYGRYRIDQPASIEMIREALESHSCIDIGNTIIDARNLTADYVKSATALLNGWTRLVCSSKTQIESVKQMMSALGFSGAISVRRNADGTFSLECEPVARRDVIPLPDFGSRANGRYRVIVIHQRDSANAIVDSIRRSAGDTSSPIIVIFLNVLDVDERRSLVEMLDTSRFRPAVVLDESLLVFLATRVCDPRRLFLMCAAPFSVTYPYDPDTPAVPKEMFFGRADERNAILSTSGHYTHLVYGGRRMGKTALFADIASDFQHSSTVIVQHLNLQGLGLGDAPDHLWQHVADELRRSNAGVVGPKARQFEGVSNGVRKWLQVVGSRRILLLLDEADDFLEADRLNQHGRYRVLSEAKKLMDETSRRFKVVFAGLHNVQRTARDSNTPFAHLGTPVRIGPMLPNFDADDIGARSGKEIHDLIRLPFEAMGYRFESRDSIIRIAAETNYYPALAQHFCKELLDYLRKSSTTASSGPPWSISQRVVDRVFHSKETRNRIRSFFLWTVELDARYKFLTYLVAAYSFDGDDQSISLQTLSVEEIRTEALRDWPQGFPDKSYLTFEVLLEEMVGLGILRESFQKGQLRYGIRSRNLRRLLGDSDEVVGKWHDAAQQDPDPSYHWAEFREVIGVRRAASHAARARSQWHRNEMVSPLTAAQERLLETSHKGVVVVFGTKMAGLDRIAEAVMDLARRIESRGSARVECEICTVSSAVSKIGKIARSKAKAELEYHFVIFTGAVFSDRVSKVVEILAASRSKARIIRPVFVCDPAAAWRWLGGGRVSKSSGVDLHEVWLGRCARDFVRRLLNERPGKKCMDLETEGMGAFSLWPQIVESVALNSGIGTVKDAISISVESGAISVQDALEVTDVVRTLQTLRDYEGEMTSHDIFELQADEEGGGISEDDVSRVLQWAEKLSIVDDMANGYRLDSAWLAGLKSLSADER